MATENPAWLNASHMQKILRIADEDDSIQVTGIDLKAATARGDNYSSDMYRVVVELSRIEDEREIQKKKSFIIKISPTDGAKQAVIEEMSVFETEFSMMSVTLPKMNEFLAKLELNPFSARCFYIQYKKPTHLVIEDLAPSGFQMADRQAGLDLDHCLLAIRNLGRFHASSIALKEKDLGAWTKYDKGMLHKDRPQAVIQCFESGAKFLATEAAKWSELSPRIAEKLRKLCDVIHEKGCDAALYREDDFNVLNHGDFWVNNMLFRYDERRRPIDHIFLDFQLSHYGSPAVDISYFLGTSPSDDVRHNHRELILREYHASLLDIMAKLKCKTSPPTFEELQEILKRRAFCEVVATVTVLPIVVLEKNDVIDIDEMLKLGVNYDNPSYQGKTYRKIMTRLLPWYDSLGLLD